MDDFRAIEEAVDLLRRATVRDVRIAEDLVETAAAMMLADDVLRDGGLAAVAAAEEGEDVAKGVEQAHSEAIV